MEDQPNSEQREFWNALQGQNWARHSDDLDALYEGVIGVLLAAARPGAGERVLDVGCGAGAQSLALARAVGPEGEVTGVDISVPLLARARERAAALGVSNATFRQADAQVEKFGKGVFDLVASRFGVMFFDEPVAAFANLRAALRPGGRMVLVAWAAPEENPWFTLPQRLAEARLGKGAESPPDAPGPMAFRDTERVLGILSAAGLADGRAEHVTTELHHPGGVEAAARIATWVGPISRLLREKGGTDADLEALRLELVERLAEYRTPDGIRVPAGVLVYSARRG